MTSPDPFYCLATPLVQSLAEAKTRRLRLVTGSPRPADFDHLAGEVTIALHQAWATAAHVDEVDVEPDEGDLAAIEAEWPVLAAELAVVDAQCRFLACPAVATRRALRRAEAARDRTVAEFSHPTRIEGTQPMNPTPLFTLIPAVLAQDAAPADIGSRLAGLAGGVAGGLAVIAVAAITAILIWQLLAATFRNPSPEKLAMIVVVALLAVFFVGATPDLIQAAYTYGQDFIR